MQVNIYLNFDGRCREAMTFYQSVLGGDLTDMMTYGGSPMEGDVPDEWHDKVMQTLGDIPLTILVGRHAHKYHLNARTSVTETVRNWRDYAPRVFALPHPSWRNTAWMKKNPWFEAELLPVLRARVQEVLND